MKLGDLALCLGMLVAACSANESSKSGANGGGGGNNGDAAGGSGGFDLDAGDDGSIITETVVVIGPGAPQDAPTKFGGTADPNASVTLVYPDTGVITPPNMNSLEFHFVPAAGQTLFEYTFKAAFKTFIAYIGCTPVGNGCVYEPDATFWEKLAGAAAGQPSISYSVRGVDAQGKVGSSEAREISFSKEDIVGGLYYWNTAGVIQRYDFGFPGKNAELYLNAPQAGALTCVGCHALSRDGTRMAVGADIPAPAPFKVFDVATRTVAQSASGPITGQANFFAFSPDTQHLLYSDGVRIGWLYLVSGSKTNPNLVPLGTMPDWSPDGQTVVFAKPQAPPPFGVPVPGVQGAGLEIMSFDGQQFGTPSTLLAYNGQNNYYPAFSPDSEWVVFNRSPSNAESFGNSPPAGDGELWAVARAGGNPVKLATASAPGSTSWPKWAPDINSYSGGTVFYFTFSSARAYGLRLAGGVKTQLWMVGFDPARAAAGQDPSFAAFRLPFQDISGGNHIAQWVTSIERQPCKVDSECGFRERCVGGRCIPQVE